MSQVQSLSPALLLLLHFRLRESVQFVPSPVRILRPQLPRVTPRANGALTIPRRVSARLITAGSRSARPPHQPSHGGRQGCVLRIAADMRMVMPVTGRRLETSNCSRLTLTLSLSLVSFSLLSCLSALSLSLSLSLSRSLFLLCARYGVLFIITPLGAPALHASFLERQCFLLCDAQLSACDPVESRACWDTSSTLQGQLSSFLRVVTFRIFRGGQWFAGVETPLCIERPMTSG